MRKGINVIAGEEIQLFTRQPNALVLHTATILIERVRRKDPTAFIEVDGVAMTKQDEHYIRSARDPESKAKEWLNGTAAKRKMK